MRRIVRYPPASGANPSAFADGILPRYSPKKHRRSAEDQRFVVSLKPSATPAANRFAVSGYFDRYDTFGVAATAVDWKCVALGKVLNLTVQLTKILTAS